MTHVVVAAPLACLLAVAAPAADDGSQMRSSFRINYLGYFQHAHKLALYVSDLGGSGSWELLDSRGRDVARGTSQDFVADDFASGDSFFGIDFSSFTGTGSGFRLRVGDRESAPFDISAGSPYGHLADEAFDYFQDHRTGETRFDQFRDSWGNGSVTGPFWNDAGDKGSYPTNTAMAAWLLINLYERYPEANASFGMGTTLYQEVRFGTRLLHEVILPGQKLAVPKLHTNVASWAPCAPHDGESTWSPYGPTCSATSRRASRRWRWATRA